MTETWAYASSTSINVTASPAEDLRTKYWPGQWVKITQTTDKFFLITATSYASPVTTLTVYGGGTYTVANAEITAHSYSIDQAPKDIPYTFRRFPYKLDDLDAPDDNTDLDASTTAHGLMPKFPNTKTWLRGDKSWQMNSWGIDFKFGDGSAVISAQSDHTRAGQKACKITKVYIRSTDGASPPGLLSGSATVKLYIHDINAEEGTAVETITLSSVSNYTTGDLSHAVAAGKWVTVEVSGITNYKCMVVSLEFEAT